MFTLGHPQTSLHGTRLITFLNKMFTLGHLLTSLHGTRLITFLNLIIIIVLSNPHYPGATLLFQRDIADDESTLSIALLEVEGVGNGIERLEGEREV